MWTAPAPSVVVVAAPAVAPERAPAAVPELPRVAQPARSGIAWLVGIALFVLLLGGAAVAGVMALIASLDAPMRVQDITPDRGLQRIDPAGLPSPYGALDPIAVYPWALARSREWAPDATLSYLSVEDVALDGHTNVAVARSEGTPSTNFRFASPARTAAARSMRQVSAQAVMTSLQIEIAGGEVRALGGTSVDAEPAPPPAFPQPACNLAQVIATMRSAGLELRPVYELNANVLLGRWVWTAHGTDLPLTPSVFADDCSLRR